jgi:hypothetical protein
VNKKNTIGGKPLAATWLLALCALAIAACGQVGVNAGSAPLAVMTSSLPSGKVGVLYSATLQAGGGTAPYQWSVSGGTLTPGLLLDPATGAITGTPEAASTEAVTFAVSDSGNPAQTASATLSLSIDAQSLHIVTTSLPAGTAGTPYSTTLSASGGTQPYTWTLTAGALPAGLTLNGATGVISGTPAAAASVQLSIQVSDSGSPAQSQSAALALNISAGATSSSAPHITTTSLPAGQVGSAYTATLAASGGASPYAWSLTSGTLPAGLSLNGATGLVSGTPGASAAAVPLTFTVTGANNLSSSATLPLTIAPVPLVITTTSLPAGQVGAPYGASLAATGGTAPYTWTLTGGALPAGLTLSPSGTIAGTPTAPAKATPLTFQVTDSSNPTLAQSVTLALTIGVGNVTITISPRAAALAVGQVIQVSATTTDPAGVSWSLSPTGGTITPATSLSLIKVNLTAPASAGVYTLTATSVSNPAVTASITVAVTGLAGVYTYHDDLARDGANTQEYALTPANVATATFGKLFSCAVDGAVYAQPLWVANLTVGSTRHNVLFAATEHDSLFAFDADANPCATLWQVSLIDSAHGGTAGETVVPWASVGTGLGDIQPEVGVTSTPVIDPAAGILYVVSKSVDASGVNFYQRLHAIDLASGTEKPGSPVTIAATYPGTGDGSTTVTFSPRYQNQRAALALVNGSVYIAWGSHEDAKPWYGWLMAYTYSGGTFSAPVVLNVCPNTQECGIWMGGGAPSADSAGHLYLITGNGGFDAANAPATPSNDYGDSFLQLTSAGTAINVSSWFTPTDQETDDLQDKDFGSGGAALVLNLGAGSPQHLVVGGGKDGSLYLLNGDAMGGYGDAKARQYFALGQPIFATGAFWNNTLYIAGLNGPMNAFAFDTTTNMFNATATSQSLVTFGFPGSTPSVSSQGASNGIVWSLDNHQYCTKQSKACGPALLHAFSAANLAATELWNSSMVAADAAGNAVKFAVPTVANGKVYIGTRGNNTGGADNSTTTPGEIDVYGLKP